MPARTPKSTKPATAATFAAKNPAPRLEQNGAFKSKAAPGALGGAAAHARINAFVSSRARRTQAKRDAR